MARILLIEDSPTDTAVLTQLLERNGHQVIARSSAEDGIEAARAELPDLVLSGVNKGRNVAEDVVYSGTIAGALEGTILGFPSFALSQEFSIETRNAPLWDTGLKFGPDIIRKVIGAGVPRNTVINVNFPACAPDEIGRAHV